MAADDGEDLTGDDELPRRKLLAKLADGVRSSEDGSKMATAARLGRQLLPGGREPGSGAPAEAEPPRVEVRETAQ